MKNVFIHENSLVYVDNTCLKSCHGVLVKVGCIKAIRSSRFKQIIEIVCFVS